ncbi:hypothetical protein [Desulfonema limicola]|uniref:hypothetical protein n=1 Tax=Desulfonema limicola TaxID=45656 RepID=UPI001A9BBF0E|nr:hypothetical protein [Desulfonema limicola]
MPFLSVEQKSSDIEKLNIMISNKEALKAVVGDMFEICIKAGAGKDMFSMYRKIIIQFMEKGKQGNKRDIITLNPGETVKKEYSFDGKDELEAVIIDAETKERIDRALIVKRIMRDLGGL